MKRKISVLVLVLLCTSAVINAQVEKGKWFLAGSSNMGLTFGKEKVKSGSTTSDVGKYTQFNLTPMVGYTVMDNLPIGLSFDFRMNSFKNSDNDAKDNTTTFSIGPFARYYFGNMNGLMPYAEGRIGFGSQSDKYTSSTGTTSTDKAGLFSYMIGVGGTHFIGNMVGLDLLLGYSHDQTKYTDNGDGNGDVTYKYGSIVLNVGVIVMLGKQ